MRRVAFAGQVMVLALAAGATPLWGQSSGGGAAGETPPAASGTVTPSATPSTDPGSSASGTGTAPGGAAAGSATPAPAPVAPAGTSGTSAAPAGTGGAYGTAPAGQSAAPSDPPVTYGTRRKLELREPPPLANPKLYTLSFNFGDAILREGAFYPSDETLQDTAFGPHVRTFRLMVGRQFFDQIQVQLDLGILSETQENEATVTTDTTDETDDGTDDTTDEEIVVGDARSLRAFPLSLGVAYRFDYFEEQPAVPYLQAGLGGLYYVFEDTENAESETAHFHRLGAYVGGGLELLLDTFEPARAADLELSSGINDCYLVFDARYYWMRHYYDSDAGFGTDWDDDASDADADDNWGFSGWQLTGGLKFDF